MSAPDTTQAPLATPDPIFTTEQIPALLAPLTAAVVVLFKLNISNEQQGAAVTILGAVYSAFVLYHAARVRSARAQHVTPATTTTTITTATPVPTTPASATTAAPAISLVTTEQVVPKRSHKRKTDTP